MFVVRNLGQRYMYLHSDSWIETLIGIFLTFLKTQIIEKRWYICVSSCVRVCVRVHTAYYVWTYLKLLGLAMQEMKILPVVLWIGSRESKTFLSYCVTIFDAKKRKILLAFHS